MKATFRGGVRPPEAKEDTARKPIRTAKLPKTVTLPLIQHTGAPCKPLVKAGDTVTAGQLIAKSDSFVSSPVHASISGKVKAIDDFPHPVCGKCTAIVIESDGTDGTDGLFAQERDPNALSGGTILAIIKESGLVGLGGAAFPTHVKLSTGNKQADSAILNGAECEPYLTCDSRLMAEDAQSVIKGLFIILKVLGARNGYIGVEENKPEAISALRAALAQLANTVWAGKRYSVKVIPLRTKYPQGSEKQLIDALLERRVPPKGLPIDVGCVVQNVGTSAAIYDAVVKGKPLIERCVTVTGDCVKEPSNIRARIGTSVKDLVEECGGLIKEPAKVIAGGPMMGIAQYSLDIPVVKGTSGILVISAEEAEVPEEKICIRCGRCVESCPMNLMPLSLAKFVQHERWDAVKEFNIMDCMECGSCAYMCPSGIPLVHYVKRGKMELMMRKER